MSFFKPLQPQIWQYLHATTPAQLVQLFIKSNSEFLNPHCLLSNSFQLQGMKTQIFFLCLVRMRSSFSTKSSLYIKQKGGMIFQSKAALIQQEFLVLFSN